MSESDEQAGARAGLFQFLRNVGNDEVKEADEVAGYEPWPECEMTHELDEDGYGHCPAHRDCGLCRYEYMKVKGWVAI